MNRLKRLASLFILIAGTLWGVMGIFVRILTGYGFSSMQIASLRIIGGALIFLVGTAFTDRKKLKIQLKDLGWFAGMGIGSILMFTICYFTTISMASLAVAAILLYTAPIMVMVMSVVLFKEKLTGRKLLALLAAFAGCIMVTGLLGTGHTSAAAVGFGLLSGFGYGLYSILGTYVLKKYSPVTVTTYSFACGAVGALIVSRPVQMVHIFQGAENRGKLGVLIFLTAFMTAVLPYLFYTIGLSSTKASSASIMASVEPVVAAVTGMIVFGEKLSTVSLLGIVLVLFAIVVLNLPVSGKVAISAQQR